MEAIQVQQQKHQQENVFKRFLWLYGLYALLNMLSFLVGYYLLPEGFMRGSPQLTFAALADSATSFWGEFGLRGRSENRICGIMMATMPF